MKNKKFTRKSGYKAIVVGVSAGGVEALSRLFTDFPPDFPLSVLAVQHIHPDEDGALAVYLNGLSALPVTEAMDKEPVQAGHIYLAPPNYHLLVERNHTLALSVDERVNYARPSIDVLFESAAEVWRAQLIGVVLTGTNRDGAAGLRRIHELGGLTIVEDPNTAVYPIMPQFALAATEVDMVLPLAQIGPALVKAAGAVSREP
ncbi:MAG: chemotaxis protein CheB [Ardenticatenaceae bacterium]|nr:chemotaxis protein CheB [Ardenticatenaceae bacterium]MCB9442784.1 chemotaxis protein CheB [Ardenticatenaceae bacterium]